MVAAVASWKLQSSQPLPRQHLLVVTAACVPGMWHGNMPQLRTLFMFLEVSSNPKFRLLHADAAAVT
jgi:hypothetical protein